MKTIDRLVRWGAVLSVLLLTGIAAVISYGHAYELVRRYGESGNTARALPLTIDGLIATCSLVLIDAARRNRRAPWHAWGLLAAGVIATVGVNVAHGVDHGPVGALVAGWPALVAVGSFELAVRLIRDAHETPGKQTADRSSTLESSLAQSPWHDDPDADRPVEIQMDPLLSKGRQLFAQDLAAGTIPSVRQIKRQLRVGHARAVRIRDALGM